MLPSMYSRLRIRRNRTRSKETRLAVQSQDNVIRLSDRIVYNLTELYNPRYQGRAISIWIVYSLDKL